ncbi:MAG: universal stress protein [Deltaproteobacteria bacterium]|nr:universal stress protein [Deltaproteobacteria bacterium]
MYKKVLVPLDGSSLAECALSHLESLFKDGAVGEVTLLNIVTIDIPWGDLESGHFDFEALRKPLLSKSIKYLAKVESRLISKGMKVKTVSLEANRPAETIMEYAKKNGMKLIVMATHGYTGFKKMMLGGIASGVLNQSPVPVLLIRPEGCGL